MADEHHGSDDTTSSDEDPTLTFAIRGFKGRVVFWMLVIAISLYIAFSFLFVMGRESKLASVPKLEKAWIVSRLEGETLATDEPKVVTDGRGVMLYLVAYGYDKVAGENYYYMIVPENELPRVVIDGEEIPRDKLKEFSFPNVRSFVIWYKVEISPHFFRDTTKPYSQRLYWTDSNKHRMGSRWWALADVRSDLIDYHYDYVGTMRYTANLQVFHERDTDKVFTDLETEGSRPESPGRIPPGAHRVTILNPGRVGLDGAYRAFFNLLAYQSHDNAEHPSQLTESFQGGDSRSILIGAMRFLGYETNYNDPQFIEKHAVRLYDGVTMDDFFYFRPKGQPDAVIDYREGGVRPGDILVSGSRYMVLVKNQTGNGEPAGGALTGDDIVLDAYNNVVMQTFAHKITETGAPISIWRLNPPHGNTDIER